MLVLIDESMEEKSLLWIEKIVEGESPSHDGFLDAHISRNLRIWHESIRGFKTTEI